MAVSPERDEYFPILYSTVASKKSATLGHRFQFGAHPQRGDQPRARGQHYGDCTGRPASQSDRWPARRLPRSDSGLSPRRRAKQSRRTAVQHARHGRRGVPDGIRFHSRSRDTAAKRRRLSLSRSIRAGGNAGLLARGGQSRACAQSGVAEGTCQCSAVDDGFESRRCKMEPGHRAGERWVDQLLPGLARPCGRPFGVGALLVYMWASMRQALRLEAANSRVLELAQTARRLGRAVRRRRIRHSRAKGHRSGDCRRACGKDRQAARRFLQH